MCLFPLVLSLVCSAWCQSQLSSTSTFRAPSITSTPDDRRAAAKAAIDDFVQNDSFFALPQPLPSLSWPHGYLLADMAQFDLLTGQKTYEPIVEKFYKPGFQGLIPAI
ncbi:hypothetical protein V5O48_003733, partial [Marasmius crinis-equi]